MWKNSKKFVVKNVSKNIYFFPSFNIISCSILTFHTPVQRLDPSQEADGQKTNNGIQYRLQLLYTNGS